MLIKILFTFVVQKNKNILEIANNKLAKSGKTESIEMKKFKKIELGDLWNTSINCKV